MKEQFVTYEIALKLKELGFDESCFAIFYQGKFMNGKIESYVWNLVNSVRTNSDCNSIDIVTAPLWQQAIDWLFINHDMIVTRDFVGYKVIQDKIHGITHSNESLPYTRETAVLKAISLIK